MDKNVITPEEFERRMKHIDNKYFGDMEASI